MELAQSIIYNPSVPFVGVIPGGLVPGKTIIIQGLVLATGGDRFEVDLYCGLLVDGDHVDDIALHFNPRFSEKAVVCNTLIANKWGQEERLPLQNRFPRGQPFHLRILSLPDKFKISLDGKPLFDYQHRVSLQTVKVIYIKGCVQVDLIHFDDGEPLFDQGSSVATPSAPPLQSMQNAPTVASAPPPPSSNGEHNEQNPTVASPVCWCRNPKVPFRAEIPAGGLKIGQQIFVTGTPKSDPKRFEVNLMAGTDFVLHLNPRFKEKIMVRNTYRLGRWEQEERQGPGFPFLPSGTFDLVLFVDTEGYKIAVNGQHFVLYTHRVPPAIVDAVIVEGDIRLQEVRII